MDSRYYEMFRNATQEQFYQCINNPEEELYDVVWDLFESVVIQPAEIFDGDFRDHNQFRYSINSAAILEFFPEATYFRKRKAPDPYKDGTDAAGVHLKFAILPYMSCLFSVGFQVWGGAERRAFSRLWRQHRKVLTDLFRRAKPMVLTGAPLSALDHASNLEELLDRYFSIRDPETWIELQYPFAEFDEADSAQNFMIYMALLYHSIRDHCYKRKNLLEYWRGRMKDFFSGRLPELPAPLPCVELAITSDAE